MPDSSVKFILSLLQDNNEMLLKQTQTHIFVVYLDII